MRYPWANVILLLLLAGQLLTGFWGLVNGSQDNRWPLWLHGIGGYAVAAVLLWKGRIIFHVLYRRRSAASWLSPPRLAAIALGIILAVILLTGWVWTFAGPRFLFGFSLMTVHALAALALAALLAWHALLKRFIFRVPAARDRRAFLRLAGASLAGLALWRTGGPVRAAFSLSGATRRFTGSYEVGSLTGVFPEVSWLFDFPRPLEASRWRLVIEGAVERPLSLSYEQLAGLPADALTETIDCTGGWYSTQAWAGVRLRSLLEMAGARESARSVTVAAVSGYDRRFSMEEVEGLLLATHLAGHPLSHGHGYPARLVAPGHRGFAWVKWVTRLRVNESGAFWQPPVPLR